MRKLALAIAAFLLSSVVASETLDLAQSPLLTLKTAPGLVMLTMGRDLPLYRAAYNDVNDLDDDGVPDIFFKPSFRYEGYYAHDRCYQYTENGETGSRFTPTKYGTAVVTDVNDSSKNYYKCDKVTWSGNFLNWITMSRIDVLRKVLYGGKRSTDNTTSTYLERTYVPQDSTLWGKEYKSVANDGYDISDYTPLQLPTANKRHMFANVSLQKGGGVDKAASKTTDKSARWTTTVNPPLMIVYQNMPGRIWDLVANEATILGDDPGYNPTAAALGASEVRRYVVRVETCVKITNKYENWCTGYPKGNPTKYKPTGLLQKYGEAKTLAFGLISGSYDNNYSGGVLRQNVDDITREYSPSTGVVDANVKGIIYHFNTFRPWGFGGNDWNCGSFVSLPNTGSCMAWGNPLGEMMFEALNYFAGGSATEAFTKRVGNTTDSPNSPEPSTKLNLQTPTWVNPYSASASRKNTSAYPICARPIQMTIGDPKTSFDSDQLPGSAFPSVTGLGGSSSKTLGTLNVSTEADEIWNTEFKAGTSKKFFIGESAGNADGNPSAKSVSSFKAIRGHAPDSTTNQGSFYGASVARYGKYAGLANPALPEGSKLLVDQVSIALDSHIPQIKIPMANGKFVSIVLLSKSVKEYGISNAKGDYQQTGAITAFFIDSMSNTNASNKNAAVNGGRPYYKFRISFSDADQGNDNESDAKVTYEIKVLSDTTLSIGVDYFNGTNGIEMHQGYVIAGTKTDGVYLDVGGAAGFGTPNGPPNVGYFLDTMPNKLPGSAMNAPATGPTYTNIATRLPLSTLAAPRVFEVGSGGGGEYIPHDMLWYAAKFGGASPDTNSPNGAGRIFNLKKNGDPENYFLANNPSQLAAQMEQAFQKAASLSSATSSAVAGNGIKVGGGSFVYQASYDTVRWGGDLSGFPVDANGNVANTASWKVSTSLPSPSQRLIVLGQGGANKKAVSTSSYTTLTAQEKTNFVDDATFQYLLGVRTNEQSWVPSVGSLRNRTSAVGDIVNSDPLYINSADFGYADTDYQTFKVKAQPQLVAIGSNDGFYRLVSATNGVEKIAFMPNAIQATIAKLAKPAYQHQFYIDGPSAFGHVKWDNTWRTVVASSLGAGGQSVFALEAKTATTDTPNPFTANDVLWEYSNDTDLGNVINKPLVGMLENGTTPVVVFGNGLNSQNAKAILFILNAKTGQVVNKCSPTDSANSEGNGMTSVSFVSTNNNGKISYLYGADYFGNVWRFDPNTSGCPVEKVFSARNKDGQTQPITGEIAISRPPGDKAGYFLMFGTGSYITQADPATNQVQSIYGVWDDLSTTELTRSSLFQQTILTPGASPFNGTRTTSSTETSKAWYDPPSTQRGWFIDLACSDSSICAAGERVVSKPVQQDTSVGQRVFFLSMIPGADVCEVGGGGWVTSLDPATGGYVKGFGKINENSTYVSGVTPRGLFLVTRDATTNNTTTSILYVSVTITGGKIPAPAGIVSVGGTTLGSDGAGTGIVGLDTSPPPTILPGFGTRRQVWRQLQ